MTGYVYLMNLKIPDLQKTFKITKKQAEEMKTMTYPELKRCEDICMEENNILGLKGKCREKLFSCRRCREDFLDNEIPESEL